MVIANKRSGSIVETGKSKIGQGNSAAQEGQIEKISLGNTNKYGDDPDGIFGHGYHRS